MMNIVFRVDASTIIGSGHVMRCLTLADALHEKGHAISFVCRSYPGNMNDLILEKYDISVLDFEEHQLYQNQNISDDYQKWLWVTPEQDAVETIQRLKSKIVDLLIVDHYALDFAWESAMRNVCKKIMVIDDIANREHDCDILLDQNLQLMPNQYENKVPKGCELLLGTKYVLLRPEFLKLHQCVKKTNQLKNIFVFLGGNDLSNVTKKVLQAILESRFSGAVNVLLGANNVHIDSLKKEFLNYSFISFLSKTKNISELMSVADLCIGAAGTTSWERCYVGLPTIMLTVAENQKSLAEALKSLNAVDYLGDAKFISVHELSAAINELMLNLHRLEEMKLISQKLVDGYGAARILEKITQVKYDSKLPVVYLRKAISDDVQKIFNLRNHPEIRKNSFSLEALIFCEHQSWFQKSLSDINKHILIASNSNDEFLGVVRFDFIKNYAEVSIYIDPVFHGLGYGSIVLDKGVQWIETNCQCHCIIAKVKPDNVVSQKLFLKAGFIPKENYYEKTLK